MVQKKAAKTALEGGSKTNKAQSCVDLPVADLDSVLSEMHKLANEKLVKEALVISSAKWLRTACSIIQGQSFEPPKSVEYDLPAPQAQVEAAIVKIKELESLLSTNKNEKVG